MTDVGRIAPGARVPDDPRREVPGVGRIAPGARVPDDPRREGRIDSTIVALAAGQHRVVAWHQMRAAGLGQASISRRTATGMLYRHHSGIYSVGGGDLRIEGVWMAAVLAVGRGAVLSHAAAAAHRDLRATPSGRIDVSTFNRSGRALPAIRVHRCRRLHPDDFEVVDAIPTTTLARTLLDMAETASRRSLERMLDQAEIRGLLDLGAIEATIARNQGRRGIARLTAALEEHRPGTTLTESELEERFVTFCRRYRLLGLQTQVPVGPYRVDATFVGSDLVIELDGRSVHARRKAFDADARRRLELTAAGRRPVPITHVMLIGVSAAQTAKQLR